MATELTTTLVRIRLGTSKDRLDFTNMLDEEKYILDSEEERRERAEIIVSAVLDGKSKLLESVSAAHKARPVTVRFLKETDEFVGADLKKYGPYGAEDIATVPHDNAHALISKGVAAKVRLDD